MWAIKVRSDCTNVQSDLGLYCPFTEPLATVKEVDEQGTSQSGCMEQGFCHPDKFLKNSDHAA